MNWKHVLLLMLSLIAMASAAKASSKSEPITLGEVYIADRCAMEYEDSTAQIACEVYVHMGLREDLRALTVEVERNEQFHARMMDALQQRVQALEAEIETLKERPDHPLSGPGEVVVPLTAPE